MPSEQSTETAKSDRLARREKIRDEMSLAGLRFGDEFVSGFDGSRYDRRTRRDFNRATGKILSKANNPRPPKNRPSTRCAATKKNGQPCRNQPQRGERFCGPHMD